MTDDETYLAVVAWWDGMPAADLEPVVVPRQLLRNALDACREWMALQEDVHPESVDGWGLERLLALAVGQGPAS